MVDYYPVPQIRREPAPEQGDEEAVPTPEVEIVWNHYEKGGAKTVAVKVSFKLPRRQDEE